MKKVLIIAEAGVNHNGDIENAKKLIDIAANAGADFVKFQTFSADKLVSKSAKQAEYQLKNSNEENSSQYVMLKKLEIPTFWYEELIEYANKKGISFLSTGFDEDSIDFLDEIGIPFFKVPSGELTNKPFLEHIAKKKKPVILSTGMALLSEIEEAINVLTNAGLSRNSIRVLHCNTEYPTPMKDVNLKAMLNIADVLKVEVGYSDHTMGIEVPIAAVALGATVIEKHFTIDRNMVGPDHLASLISEELKHMVSAIRNIELAISGSGIKVPSESELKNIFIARKSIHISRNLNAGEILQKNDLIMKRPGDGISPMEIEKVIGKKLKNELKEEDKLSWMDIEK